MNDLISIVLPVYNGERFLRKSIDSIIEQTYTEWELLILDDCSSDETANISKEYCKKDDRIHYYLNEKNLRLPGNLNRGFSLAKGSYLTWTSDDNMYHSNALECMIRELKKHKSANLVYASYQIIDEYDNLGELCVADPKGKDHILGSNVVGACFLYTRKAYEAIGDYDTSLLLVEDFDYWQRMMAKFEAIAIPEVLYDYRWHSSSMTSTKKIEQFGFVTEKMLIKNKDLYGKLNVEQKAYFLSCLRKSYENQGKHFDKKFEEKYYRLINRLLNKIKMV